MITYEKISRNPHVANGLIGMSLEEFADLYAKFERVHTARIAALQHTQKDRRIQRRRAAGAGPKHKYALCDRLLMTLFWLRAYTTYRVLGTLYDLDKTTVETNVKSVMQTLALMACFNLERPQAEIPKLRSVEEVIKAFPDVQLFMEVREDSSESRMSPGGDRSMV